ncbi:MAG: TatD family hydrolase [Chloroflexi bacterium]|nr:TatD family hydrolase [Chloroflexota bacterium]
MMIDAHTHLDQYDPDQLPGILERARRAGVGGIIVAGVTLSSSADCINLARAHPGFLWAGIGIHPMDIHEDMDANHEAELRRLASDPRVVCMSEIGLDFSPGMPDRVIQENVFRTQLRIASDLGLSVIFHNREAGLEPLRMIREELRPEHAIVAHYFQGPRDYMKACLDLGIYLSLAKPLLRLGDLQELVRTEIPLDRIVLETDSFPQPFKKNRANWTEPWHLGQVAAKVAELKGLDLDQVVERTTANLRRAIGEPLTRHISL